MELCFQQLVQYTGDTTSTFRAVHNIPFLFLHRARKDGQVSSFCIPDFILKLSGGEAGDEAIVLSVEIKL